MAGKNHKDKAMLTAAEACAMLGIKAQTLYAYVSRGQLRAETYPGRTGKLYARDDVEMLMARSRARAGHGPTAASAMRWGDPILDSAITCIQAGQIYYRGYSLRELLRKGFSFEQVAELLWSGELPLQKVQWSALPIDAGTPIHTAAPLARRVLHRLAHMALLDPEGQDELIDQTLKRARGLIRQAVDELFPGSASAPAAMAPRIADSIGWDQAEAVDAIDAALISSADHELNASTFAARVAASTGADLYASILAAVASFSGRHHGLASLEVHAFITEPPAGWSRKKQLSVLLESSQLLPGFGHRLYADGDPRVEPLLQKARALAAARKGEAQHWMEEIEGVLSLAKTMGCPLPNLDLGLVAVALALGLPREGGSALFIIGRLAGWTAHILEQRQQGFMLRPRARYVGRAPMPLNNGNP
ncbi:MAG TPA: citrate synthase family protein [Oligoflexus sp.]|uniref:citrate synthase family protein n=1 Tax=Oligoflexus sp. TaxID=1971216 RepID=UPI002D578F67|nr:citrate synthase family protein [Oligoflexus sp.]HYX36212.1 citrate synthase family protein [Oligoflexus sp.]